VTETVAEKAPDQGGARMIATMSSKDDAAFKDTMAKIETLGLTQNLLELETEGFTVIQKVLSEDRIERAKAAIIKRAEKTAGGPIDPATATAQDFNGMAYQHYLMFDDPVFAEILLEPKPLALMHYLLGKSCVLSSMGSHFRGPGGMPLPFHADGVHVGMTEASLVGNCNYALTPYSRETGALAVVPRSHKKCRQPTPQENWMSGHETVADVITKELSPEDLDQVEWTPPQGAITLEIDPGDAVIWHGNTWHGGWRRDALGTRINLAAYFCRPHLSTQELRGDERYPEVFERYANEPMFAQLMGENVFNGWRDEGPDLNGANAGGPTGLYD
jgi:ectoine hydroxylase-related dioxygenase (phytanoyl-CoA dioxygenase family)